MAKILYFVTDSETVAMQFALEHKDSEVGICLLQDAVYFGCKGKGGRPADEAIKRGVKIFAAKKDVELRGLTTCLIDGIKLLGYEEIIDLVLEYERIINM